MTYILVGIIGDSETDNYEELEFAEKLGEELAKRGYAIICGGRGGVMEAVAKGAKKYGGLTIGILPGFDKSEANPYIDVVIPTGLGWARNSIVALAADIIVAIGGKSGTLSEIAYAWMYGKKIIAVKNFGGWAQKLAGSRIDERRDDFILPATTVKEVISYISSFLNKTKKDS
ncbi:MAG: TIGR00725 family protein [Candidatus Njordarchaeales archaeon]